MSRPIDLAANMDQAQKEGKLGTGSTFKFKEGPNRMRIVDGFLPHNDVFAGKPTFKWLTRIIDRRDGTVKLFFMGHTVYKQLAALQQDKESGTDFTELPMPYDINVNAVGAGTMEAKYTVIAARQSTPLTRAEEDAIDKEDALEKVQEAIRAKKDAAPTPAAAPGFDPDEVPY